MARGTVTRNRGALYRFESHPWEQLRNRRAHPHRFRDTFAVDMLARGASPYDVAKLLGDEIATVEKHYAEFVKELRERVRRMMESNEGGLEAFSKPGIAVKRSGVQ